MVDANAELDFLKKHHKADGLIVDADTNQVVAAEYRTCEGRPRTFPVRFWINGDAENLERK